MSCFQPVARRHSLAPVARRNRSCCPFPTELGDYHEPGISARWPDVKRPHFCGNYKKSQGQKVCRLKAKWLDATRLEDIAQQNWANTYRLNFNALCKTSKPFLSTFFIKFFSSSAHFGKKSSPLFFSDGKLQP